MLLVLGNYVDLYVYLIFIILSYAVFSPLSSLDAMMPLKVSLGNSLMIGRYTPLSIGNALRRNERTSPVSTSRHCSNRADIQVKEYVSTQCEVELMYSE
jgi:hypothetical protein